MAVGTSKDIREYLTEQSIVAYREHVIEECAQVVLAQTEQASYPLTVELGRQMAAAIRALKEKP